MYVAMGVVIGIVVFVLIGGIVAVSYWAGYRSGENQNVGIKTPMPTPAAAASPAPTPTPAATPSPTPTPELEGKYSSSKGDVDITMATQKEFAFKIDVATGGAAGAVDGKGSLTSASVGVYTVIPDKELYNDPDSSYYHEKCVLTFRFSPGRVKVTESDNLACGYYHGAQIDFNGSFAKKK